MEQFTIFNESPSQANKAMEAGEMVQMQSLKQEGTEKSVASALTTLATNNSAEEKHPSPPHNTTPAGSYALSMERTAEDELSSSPNKEAKLGHDSEPPIRADILAMNLRNHLEAKEKTSKAKKWLGEEERFNLGQYTHLVTTTVDYRYVYSQHIGSGVWELFSIPLAPADDIKKSLHLGRGRKGLKWTGPWAEQKLKKEIAKYEAVKEFWLFEYSSVVFGSIAGCEKKEEWCVSAFCEQLKSPWVRCWLREFLGDEIMDRLEVEMMKFNERQEKETNEDTLRLQGSWEMLRLRFASSDALV